MEFSASRIFGSSWSFASYMLLFMIVACQFLGIAILALSQLAGASTFIFPANTDYTKELGCTPLRILCVGDSITQGSLSSSGDGYRGYLQSLLINSTNGGAYGADVDFVGTLRRGNMTDNSHDGQSGAYLSDLLPVMQTAIESQPNVVLIHAGSNDMDKNVRVSSAIDRLESIIRAAHDGAPNATIFVAQLIVSNSAPMQDRTDAFNPQISSLVDTLRAAPNDFSIVNVNMSRILTPSQIEDRKHPGDEGYSIMARAWYDAIADSTSNGLIKAPVEQAKPEPSLGLGLEGAPLTPNITCRANVPATATTSNTATALSGGGSVTSPGADSTNANAAATSVASTGVALRIVAPSSWLAFLLSFAVALTP